LTTTILRTNRNTDVTVKRTLGMDYGLPKVIRLSLQVQVLVLQDSTAPRVKKDLKICFSCCCRQYRGTGILHAACSRPHAVMVGNRYRYLTLNHSKPSSHANFRHFLSHVGPLRFHCFDVSAHVTVLMSSRST
jgi:hypothetical protein